MQQSGEHEPFIDEILRLLHRITVDLTPQQVSLSYSIFFVQMLTLFISGPHVLRGSRIHDLSPTQ